MSIQTKLIKMTDEEGLLQAANSLASGGLVVFPTETVYGLGASALDPFAAQKVYAAKGRPSDNPLIVHLSCIEEAEKYCFVNDTFYKLCENFSPGPLTMILPKKKIIPDEVTAGLDSVALRIPSNAIAHRLIALSKVPVAAPSANLSGKPSPTCAKHVIDDLMGRVDYIIDGGDCEVGLESTVVKIEDTKVTLIRPGGVTYEELCEVHDFVVLDKLAYEQCNENMVPISPGVKYKHYAPKAKMYVVDGEYERILSFMREKQQNENCGILCFEEDVPFLTEKNRISLGSIQDHKTQAQHLFAAFRTMDDKNVDTIYTHAASREGMGLAVYNRLIKAAGFEIINV